MDVKDEEAARIREIDAAQKARDLLENEYVDSLIRAMKVEAEQEFLSVPPSDHHAFIAAQQKYKALADLVGRLRQDVQTGEMAKTQLQKMREAVKQWRKTG